MMVKQDCHYLILSHELVQNVEKVHISGTLLQLFSVTAVFHCMKDLVTYISIWAQTTIIQRTYLSPSFISVELVFIF